VTWLLNDRIRFDGNKYMSEAEKTAGLSPRTANDILKILRTSFRLLLNDSLVSENPCDSVKNIKQQDKVIAFLTVDELKSLLNAPDQRKYADFRD
jgi:integrase/recombinase XerD